jgi:stearoyl-CoA desaturase (delta-9 desaturase)
MNHLKPDHKRGNSAEVFTPNWMNILFLIPMHLAGLIVWPIYLAMGGGIHWQECAIFVLMFSLGVIGINVGYHRSLSHLSFKMSPVLKALALFGGATVAEGSVLTWCADHRRHHKFQDTDNDPYNIRRGFWWAHMGWILGNTTTSDYSNCPDLQRDPMIRNQHKYYFIWFMVSSFVFPLALGFLVGRPLAAFLFAGVTRLMFINHCTYMINSYAHYFGRQAYSTEITARDSLICALLAQGEGWHNFHHRFPWDYRNGHRFYHYDPTKWFIYFGQFVGLTRDLKMTPAPEIYRARIQTLKGRVQSDCPDFGRISESLESALAHWQRLNLEWQRFKEEMEQSSKDQIVNIRRSLELARRDFKIKYQEWLIELRAQPVPAYYPSRTSR